MYQYQIDRFGTSEPLLPRVGNVTRRQISALSMLIDSPVDCSINGMALAQAGCHYLPLAGIAITATNCAPPLVRAEATRICRLLQCDLILLRSGAEQGGTVEIKLAHREEWLDGYLPWLCEKALWFIPSATHQPLFDVAGGLFERSSAPFVSAAARSVGIEQAYRALAKLERKSI